MKKAFKTDAIFVEGCHSVAVTRQEALDSAALSRCAIASTAHASARPA
jgi:hypothetical protein